MPAATPEQVRADLTAVTAAAGADVAGVAASADAPAGVRAALFAAVPLIVAEYAAATAALALDWYDQLRDAASPSAIFTPQVVAEVDGEGLAASVAWATEPLRDLEQRQLGEAVAESLQRLLPDVQKATAAGFRDTMVVNSTRDRAASGWRRYTNDDGDDCKFCRMLAYKGAVYSRDTARFAAHTDCECLAGPSFDPDAPRASVMQYVASQKTRTPKEQAALRDYLNQHYPDAPG